MSQLAEFKPAGDPQQPGQGDVSPLAAARRASRSCGPCRACCIAPEIMQLDKAADTPCAFLRRDENSNGACSIYNHRPEVCRGFLCGWRLGLGDLEDRPDRLGVLIQPVGRHDGTAVLAFVETEPDALQSERARRLLLTWGAATGGHVTIRYAGGGHFTTVPLTADRVVVTDAARRAVHPETRQEPQRTDAGDRPCETSPFVPGAMSGVS